jgi:hypothetical protein
LLAFVVFAKKGLEHIFISCAFYLRYLRRTVISQLSEDEELNFYLHKFASSALSAGKKLFPQISQIGIYEW